MQKLLIATIKFCGRQLERLAELKNKEAATTVLLAEDTAEQLNDHADKLRAKAGRLQHDAEYAVQEAKRQAVRYNLEASKCSAIAQTINNI